MRQKRTKGIRVGSSDYQGRMAELRANHESEELKSLLARGFEVADVKVKRKRIPKKVVVSLGGSWQLTMTTADYRLRGAGLKVIMEIY